MFHTPWSSFFIGEGSTPSRSSSTSLALGDRKRKVTLPSECTSGETIGAGGREGGVCAGLSCAIAKIPSSERADKHGRRKNEIGFIAPSNQIAWIHGLAV